MDYELSDSSGTDDDLPPHRNRFPRGGKAPGSGRSGHEVSAQFSRMNNDMEIQIHQIEQEAYCSVLRAFKAQSDAITWEKEGLITELRKELRVSDEEHRELLLRVDNDDTIQRISEWRKASGLQPGLRSSTQAVHEPMPSPTISASRKKQRMPQSMASLSAGPAPQTLHQNLQQSSSAFKRGSASGARGKKPKASMQYPSAGPASNMPIVNQVSGGFMANEHTEATTFDPLIGRKVWTRWPENNKFYEAVITDYKEGRHALVYDINSATETWEWVNLKEISPEDIRWEGEDPSISHRGGSSGPGRGMKKGRGGCTVGMGRGRGIAKGQSRKELTPAQNGIGKNLLADIEILHTETLIKEVEKVFSSHHPGTVEIEKAKKVLKDHEQALLDAITRLEDASDGESDEGLPPFSQGQSDLGGGWRKRPYNEVSGERRLIEASDGGRTGRDGRIASY